MFRLEMLGSTDVVEPGTRSVDSCSQDALVSVAIGFDSQPDSAAPLSVEVSAGGMGSFIPEKGHLSARGVLDVTGSSFDSCKLIFHASSGSVALILQL